MVQEQTVYNPDNEVMRPFSDLGNAERFQQAWHNIAHYCFERKRWLIWDGKVWAWDNGAKVGFLAASTIRFIYKEAAETGDKESRNQLVQHALKSESDHRINAMLNRAQSQLGIPIKISELDQDHYLFNCQNGTVNLRTGELLKHDPHDFITIIVPYEYTTEAICPRWLQFLNEVTAGDTALQQYLQRTVGYSLTGNTKNQVLFFLYGLGNNGKSTFTSVIRKLMGPYGERANTDLFLLKDKNVGGPKEGLANLQGKRFVVASELEEGRRFAVSLIKDMTGGETIKADKKYEHEIEFESTYKIWLVGNHKPIIADTTLSIWRRVKLIPFTVTIPKENIDLELSEKLEKELPGILNWAVEGCLDWQKYGLNEPSIVVSATDVYRRESDVLGDFLEDCCALNPAYSIPKSELKNAYEKWCETNRVEPIGQRTFKSRLMEKGIGERKSGGTRFWQGIKILTTEERAKLVAGEPLENSQQALAIDEKVLSLVPNLALKGQLGGGNSINLPYKAEHKKSMEKGATVCPLDSEKSMSCPKCPTDGDHPNGFDISHLAEEI